MKYLVSLLDLNSFSKDGNTGTLVESVVHRKVFDGRSTLTTLTNKAHTWASDLKQAGYTIRCNKTNRILRIGVSYGYRDCEIECLKE